MEQDKTGATPSKGEVAFRFIACTSVALALYYTPDLRWSSTTSAPQQAAQIDAASTETASDTSVRSCSGGDEALLLADVAIGGTER
ncbi:hypothetical protein D3218_08485 [Aureimonas flava]|uniref:Uncharacterized protein n=1 Tax=Aureimonas flava TaxID=2320271 RepID=A0A3A1WLZ2_9HYPH|nr:hypothetical protein [Aureimonas flava]RIY01386.1 hypothetical protein D3218_08485 [Aureimonas flava]